MSGVRIDNISNTIIVYRGSVIKAQKAHNTIELHGPRISGHPCGRIVGELDSLSFSWHCAGCHKLRGLGRERWVDWGEMGSVPGTKL